MRQRLLRKHRRVCRLPARKGAQPRPRSLQLEALEDRATPAVLVAAYGFDEGSGTGLADLSGHGNAGTASGTTWSTAGKYGDALSFDGISSLVTIADSASLDLTTGMTLEAWVKPTTVSSAWRDVIYKGTDVYYLEATSAVSSLPAGGATIGSSTLNAYGTAPITANAWTHLALTFDGTNLVLYVNGAQAGNSARSGTILTSANPVQIGGDSLYGQQFTGLIDEVRIYDGALSAAQITTDMNSPVAATPDNEPPSADEFERDDRQQPPDQPGLDRGDRQRGSRRLPRRAQGTWRPRLRANRHAHDNLVGRQRPGRQHLL